jgi:CheY-like chemotaxis protein
MLASHLSAFGFVLSPAESIAEAMEIRSAANVDLVVYDGTGTAPAIAHAALELREGMPGMPILVLLPPAAASAFRAAAPADPLLGTTSKPVKTLRLLEVAEALLAGQPAPARPSSVSEMELAAPVPTSGTALVVDDNELNRRVALEMVRRLGLTARAVGSGKEAILAAQAEHFDYVLMDVQMPDMDGFEATRRLLQATGSRRPRVIATTANALPGDRERCLAAGMSDYVTKPIRPGALAKALKREYGDDSGTERSGITDVLDAQVLEDLRMLEATSGTPLIADLASSFRSDVPDRIAELRTALAGKDYESVRKIAHRLRGSAGAVGANRVFLTATEIETKATDAPDDGIGPMIDQLAKEVGRAIDAFARMVERMQRDKAQREGDAPSV